MSIFNVSAQLRRQKIPQFHDWYTASLKKSAVCVSASWREATYKVGSSCSSMWLPISCSPNRCIYLRKALSLGSSNPAADVGTNDCLVDISFASRFDLSTIRKWPQDLSSKSTSRLQGDLFESLHIKRIREEHLISRIAQSAPIAIIPTPHPHIQSSHTRRPS
jgi:hypothetical protein